MDWIEPFYTKRSAWMGPTGIFASHRARAASIERYSGAGKKRILELGAGAGGTAAALADLGHSVIDGVLNPAACSTSGRSTGVSSRHIPVNCAPM